MTKQPLYALMNHNSLKQAKLHYPDCVKDMEEEFNVTIIGSEQIPRGEVYVLTAERMDKLIGFFKTQPSN